VVEVRSCQHDLTRALRVPKIQYFVEIYPVSYVTNLADRRVHTGWPTGTGRFWNGATVTVNAERYIHMLNNTFLRPQMKRQRLHNMQNVYFQQVGDTPHTARLSMDVVRRMFPGRFISRFGNISWPPRFPDLTTCDFFCFVGVPQITCLYSQTSHLVRSEGGNQGGSGNNWSWDGGTRIRRFSAKAWKLHSRKWTPPAWYYLSFIICNSNGMQVRRFFCNKIAFSLKKKQVSTDHLKNVRFPSVTLY